MDILSRGWTLLQHAPKEDLRALLELLRSGEFPSSLLVETVTHAVRESRLGLSDLIDFFPGDGPQKQIQATSDGPESDGTPSPKRRKLTGEPPLEATLQFVTLIVLSLQQQLKNGTCERSLITDQVSAVIERLLALLHTLIGDFVPSSVPNTTDSMEVDAKPTESLPTDSDREKLMRKLVSESLRALVIICGNPAFVAVIAILKHQRAEWWQAVSLSLQSLQSRVASIHKSILLKQQQGEISGLPTLLWLLRESQLFFDLILSLDNPNRLIFSNPRSVHEVRRLSRPETHADATPGLPMTNAAIVTEYSPPLFATNLLIQQKSLGIDAQAFVCQWAEFDSLISEEVAQSRLRSVEDTASLIEQIGKLHRLKQREIYGALLGSALRCDSEQSVLAGAVAWRQYSGRSNLPFAHINDTRWLKSRSWLLSKLPQVIAILRQRRQAREESNIRIESISTPIGDIEWAFSQVSDVGITQRNVVVQADAASVDPSVASNPAVEVLQDILYDVLKAFHDRGLLNLSELARIAAADFFKQNLQTAVKRLEEEGNLMNSVAPENGGELSAADQAEQMALDAPQALSGPSLAAQSPDSQIEALFEAICLTESSPEVAVDSVRQLVESFRVRFDTHGAASRYILSILDDDNIPHHIVDAVSSGICSTPLLQLLGIQGVILPLCRILFRRCDYTGNQTGPEAHKAFESVFLLLHHILETFAVREDENKRGMIQELYEDYLSSISPSESGTINWLKSYLRDTIDSSESKDEDGLNLARIIFKPAGSLGLPPDAPETLQRHFTPFKVLSLLGWIFNKTVELLCASNAHFDENYSQRLGDGIPTLLSICPYSGPMLAHITFREYRMSARDDMSGVKYFLAEIMANLIKVNSTSSDVSPSKSVAEVVLSRHLLLLSDAFPTLKNNEPWNVLLQAGFAEAHSLDPESHAFPTSFTKFRSFDAFAEAMLYNFLNHRRLDPVFWSQARRFAHTGLPLTYSRTVVFLLLKEIRSNLNHRLRLERTIRTVQFLSVLASMASQKHMIALFDVVLDSTLPSLRSAFEAEFLALFVVATCVRMGLPSNESRLSEASSSLRSFSRRVLAMLEIDVGLRQDLYTSTASRARQLVAFDKFPVGAFATTLVELSIDFPEWWMDPANVKGIRADLLQRLKQWEPAIGGAFALSLFLRSDVAESPAAVLEYFWKDVEIYDSENTIQFD